ncbi:efflux RND transporter periplasmic adaptor subunit [Motiliproteus sp. MSK22-1]|uniref:efflux RND transporter periplasmic adaptor subunit n=1 Tax=Motiliproteus sp. MSK22-1 TaxID=1897630 RepID=UPI000976F21F|nr:efflux RND transporter periplasmic adaptor subunit [Motiliproteus sp. MSK22-1]OMH25701.1 hypothetical protein BGP75_24490 [Motiliproteus sp. MSK22-1]
MTSKQTPLGRKIIPFVVAAIVLFLSIVIFKQLVASKPQAPEKPIQEKTWTVQTLSARPEPIAPNITLYGRIESPRSSELSAAVTAYVNSLHVDEGSHINAGEILLTLDSRDAELVVRKRTAELEDINARIKTEINRYQSDLKALQIEKELLNLAKRSVERFKALKGRKVGTETQLDDAQRNYQQQALSLNNRQREINDHENRLSQLKALQSQAQVQLESAQLDLERTKIIAPFSGRIARVSVAPGDRVRSGDKLLMMYDTEALEVRAQIPSRYLNRIRNALEKNQPLTATAELDGQQLKLQLLRISGEVGTGRAGVDSLLRITSETQNLELGRSLELSLTLPVIDNLLSLPPQALYGTDRIYIVENDHLKALKIERIGEIDQDGEPKILVTSNNIKPGDQIVFTQLPNAITGLKVKIAGG